MIRISKPEDEVGEDENETDSQIHLIDQFLDKFCVGSEAIVKNIY